MPRARNYRYAMISAPLRSSFSPNNAVPVHDNSLTKLHRSEIIQIFPDAKKEIERKKKKRKVPRYCPVFKAALQGPSLQAKENNESVQPTDPGSDHAAPQH